MKKLSKSIKIGRGKGPGVRKDGSEDDSGEQEAGDANIHSQGESGEGATE